MNLYFFAAVISILFTACNAGDNAGANAQNPSELHKVMVKEVLQTSNYTYLLVTENDLENWLALPSLKANPGEIYYYRNGFKMTDFDSKELGKKFETVYFLESISKTPELIAADSSINPHSAIILTNDSTSPVHYKAEIKVEKENVTITRVEQGITISELFRNKEKYAGKSVIIRGKVTKFNASIMKRNWIHIQDGSEFDGNFDLTATTGLTVAVGDTITLEGRVSLNKDFGYGYSYDVLLEEATQIIK